MTEIILTDEQKQFIAECEKEFEDRFTERDAEYMKIKSQELNDPPIMDPWYNKPPRNFDWSRQNQGHDQGSRRNQSFKRRHDRSDRSDRNSDHYHNYKRN